MAELLKCIGSTSTGSRIRPGVFLKSPMETDHEAVAKQVKLAFSIEAPILQRLGPHPRIVRYLGEQGKGLLLGEASHGNLQAYINSNNASIELSQRKKWPPIDGSCRLHPQPRRSLDLLLCDFGGAARDEPGLDGNQLPNDPFYDPTQGFETTPALDIFSLGSIFYTILTGYWPYRTRTFLGKGDHDLDYADRVNPLFSQRQCPDVTGFVGGKVIMGC
ncbi:hypothetical protein BKA61DRAFT_739405 [Leptodontidium sp. MPI-SDFR-AT-0119]|nr:hypothetical protein BKA61DRAFT_739405 [Leptodontidium sp. MPI-SDFR-AT-0119]